MGGAITFFPKSYRLVFEVVEEIVFSALQAHTIEPITSVSEKFLARPALFLKLKEKMQKYSGGYLMPKKPSNLSFHQDVNPPKI